MTFNAPDSRSEDPPAGPYENCTDCGTKMVWQYNPSDPERGNCPSWMCPNCVLRRCDRAEKEERRLIEDKKKLETLLDRYRSKYVGPKAVLDSEPSDSHSGDGPSQYDKGQHELICELLGVSPSPDEPGDTAYEAVVRLQGELGSMETRLYKEADRTGEIEGQLAAERKAHEETKSKLQAAMQAVANIGSQLNSTRNYHGKVVKELNSANAELRRTKAENEKLRAINEDYFTKLTASQGWVHEGEKQNKKLKAENEKLREALTQLHLRRGIEMEGAEQ